MTRQVAPPAATLALALLLAACGGGGDATEPTPAPAIAGVYPLRTYNGAALPTVVGQNATQGTLELTAGHVTLRDDGTFNESVTFRLTPPGAGAVVQVDSLGSTGRYTTNAARAQIVFTFPDGEVVNASFAEGTITVVGQATFVYRR